MTAATVIEWKDTGSFYGTNPREHVYQQGHDENGQWYHRAVDKDVSGTVTRVSIPPFEISPPPVVNALPVIRLPR